MTRPEKRVPEISAPFPLLDPRELRGAARGATGRNDQEGVVEGPRLGDIGGHPPSTGTRAYLNSRCRGCES